MGKKEEARNSSGSGLLEMLERSGLGRPKHVAVLGELREIFELVDDDKGGSIDCDELGKLLTILGMNLSHAEVS